MTPTPTRRSRPFRIDIPQADLDDLATASTAPAGPTSCPGGWDYGVARRLRAAPGRLLAERLRLAGGRGPAQRTTRSSPPRSTGRTSTSCTSARPSPTRSADPHPRLAGLDRGVPRRDRPADRSPRPRRRPGRRVPPGHPVAARLRLLRPDQRAGLEHRRIAAAWAELMRRLGYERYGAAGNDAGSMISPELGRLDPEHVIGVHVTQIFSFPSGDPAEFADLTEEEQRARDAPVVRREQDVVQHAHGAAAADAGLRDERLAARPARLERPAVRRGPRPRLRPDERHALLAHRHGRLGGAALLRERPRDAGRPSRRRCRSALAAFGGDFSGIRRFAERDHSNIVRWTTFDHGGHFAAHKAPDELTGDIQAFFGGLERQ